MFRPILVCILAALPLLAQYRGTINGELTDATGSVIPGAKVKVRGVAIGLERDTTSNAAGFFTVPNLPAAVYEVAVEATGFKSLTRTDVRLDVDLVLTLRLQLEVGQVTERVEVTGEAPPVEVSNGEVSRLLSSTQMQNYALPGRNPYYMLGILPGVVSRYGNFATDMRGGSYSMGGLQINGQRKDTNFMTLDGVSNTRNRDGVQVNNILGVDFIEEVKIQTSHYAPEYGRTTGAHLMFITRRGTSDFHGALYEFFVTDQFAATPFLQTTKPRTRYHNYGGTLGGPVYIPGKWNTDKSRLFFFVGVEARYSAGFNAKAAVLPTPLERSGDFSASAVKPLDPDTKAPFPSNLIPASRIGSFGKALQKIYPDPNWPGPGGNYYAVRNQPTENRDPMVRVDYNIKPNWQLSARVLKGQQDFTSPFDNTGNNIPLFEVYRDRRGNNYSLALNTTFSPTTVNEFTFGYSDFREDFRIIGDGVKRSTYGFAFPEIYPGNREDRIPNVSISGYQGISGSGQPSYVRTPTFTFRDNFTRIMGSHSLKAGFYWEAMNMNELNTANDNGSFSFGNSSSNPRNSGNSWANALLGNFDAYSESGPPAQTVYKAYAREFYIQDSWRLSRRFTIEYGMRYSLISPWWAKWNNMVVFMQRFWDPAKAPQLAANGSIIAGTGDIYNGLVLPGDGWPDSAKGRVAVAGDSDIARLFHGIPKYFNPLRKTNFQPRLSFAWDVFGDGKMAVRGGGGVFHGVTGIAYSGWYLGGSRAPLVLSSTITNGTADNPSGGIPNTTRFPIDAGSLPVDYKIPTVYIYSLGIQRQLPFKTALDVSYVGNTGRQLSMSRPLNFLTPTEAAAHVGVDTRPFLPYRGLGGLNIVEPSATSSYNSLQVGVTRRSGDLTYSLAYTFGKIIGYGNEGVAGGMQNPLDRRSERSELEESRRQNIVLLHTYELPWFKAQRGPIGRVLGGWSVSGIWTWNTGRLYAPGLTSAQRQVASRPDVVGEWSLDSSERTPFRWFRKEAFARPKDWTYGNAGKWVLRGPGAFDLSAFALKDVKMYERLKLQLRVEAFNAPNHPYWTDLNTTLGSSAFGQVGGISSMRYIQLGVKLLW
ncbi:MAG: carboxypeptidase-like regulatory domain-containing protein [Acidobacteriales bacterium]|nr:carboxypeptidase-like regulatory domain-containing protein [Terriglobales bacterium]